MILRGLILVVWLAPAALAQQIVHVRASAPAGGDGASWQMAFRDLRQAIDSAVPPAEIWVAAGTYKPTSGTDRAASFPMKSGIGLYGGFGGWESERDQRDWTLNETILSGELGDPQDDRDNSCRVLTATGVDSTAVLDGFSVTRGYARNCSYDCGGGLLLTGGNPVVRNSRFHKNTSGCGGGIYNRSGARGRYSDLLIYENSSGAGGGGGMGNQESSPTLERVVFRKNVAGSVGGAYLNWESSHSVCIDCVFEDNRSTTAGGAVHDRGSSPVYLRAHFEGNVGLGGGAMDLSSAGTVCIGCTFRRNGTPEPISGGGSSGGALYIAASTPVFINSVFEGNVSYYAGGAATNVFGSHTTFINVVFAGNRSPRGGALSVAGGSARVVNASVAGNRATLEGGAFRAAGGSTTVLNSLVWDNRLMNGQNQPISFASGSLTMRDGLLEGGCHSPATCERVRDEDPLLVRLPVWNGTALVDAGDLRLLTGSPAIDAGNLEHLPPDTFDLDGDGDTAEPLPVDLLWEPRVLRKSVDLGAYEGPTTVAGEPALADVRSGLVVYPNPVTDAAVVVVDLPRPGRLVVAVYDLLGRIVLTLYDGAASGRYVAVLEAERLPAGVYVLKATGEGVSESRRITVLR